MPSYCIKFKKLLFCLLLIPLVSCGSRLSDSPDLKTFIDKMVARHQFDREALWRLFSQVEIKQDILKQIQTPVETKPWYFYEQLYVTPTRIQGGVDFWQSHTRALSLAEKRYGVPREIIVAILGVETRYGSYQGKHRVIDALSTLAFQYPARAPFFTQELEHYLLLAREQSWDPLAQIGSYAGAMGQAQFMPSSYRRYAVDVNHKGFSDLMHNDDDAIFSIAYYLKEKGWVAHAPIADRARARGLRYLSLSKTNTAMLSVRQLKRYGLRPVHPVSPKQRARFLILEEKQKHGYFLGYQNFYVITRYNTSVNYAMAVVELSEKIKHAMWRKRRDTQHAIVIR